MKTTRTDNFLMLLVALAGLIPVAFELLAKDSTNLSGLFLLIAILAFIVLYFAYTFIWSSIIKYRRQIESNTAQIASLEGKLNYKSDFHHLDKRLSIMEAKNERKGSN